jgi:hypothetical protein
MRVAVVVVLLVAVGVLIADAIPVAHSSTASPNPLVFQAKAEIAALERAEGGYYAKRRRYTAQLPDLLSFKGGSQVFLESPGLDIHVDVSSDGESIMLRVNSPAIGLGSVLKAGKTADQACLVLNTGGVC